MTEPAGPVFLFRGQYRLQSKVVATPSLLGGRFVEPPGTPATARQLGEALCRSPLWRGQGTFALQAAEVSVRAGAFDDGDDALYYADVFVPEPGTSSMTANVLDLTKLRRHWKARREDAERLLGAEALTTLERWAGDLDSVATTEYLCHEAGHATGWDVGSKHRSGYFRLSGTTAWPLVFVEEFRADMQALGLAVEALGSTDAPGVLAYHLVHRFGLAGISARTGVDGAGAVPYLLFCVLLDVGFLRVMDDRVVLPAENLGTATMRAMMRECSDHAARELTLAEADGADPIDVGINAAAYFRRRCLVDDRLRSYTAWVAHGT